MREIVPKGLSQILEEDTSLKEKFTYQEFVDNQVVPHNSDNTIEKAYEDYKKIKSGK